jgi:DNA processing protein
MSVMNAKDILIRLAIKSKGDWDKEIEAIKEHDGDVENIAIGEADSHVITIIDADYPQGLRNGYKPPLVLFYEGDKGIIDKLGSVKAVSFVETRNPSKYSAKKVAELAAACAKMGVVVITGLAAGIETVAAKAALDAKGKVIAVLGNGFSARYPAENSDLYDQIAKEGIVISEYPSDVAPETFSFPARNRIVASLANAIIVGQATTRSGCIITVNYALGHNAEIGCLPHEADPDDEGNLLISEGAQLIQTGTDVAALLGMTEIPEAKTEPKAE